MYVCVSGLVWLRYCIDIVWIYIYLKKSWILHLRGLYRLYSKECSSMGSREGGGRNRLHLKTVQSRCYWPINFRPFMAAAVPPPPKSDEKRGDAGKKQLPHFPHFPHSPIKTEIDQIRTTKSSTVSGSDSLLFSERRLSPLPIEVCVTSAFLSLPTTVSICWPTRGGESTRAG